MSLDLNNGTQPETRIYTVPQRDFDMVMVGDIEMPMHEFCAMVSYVMTNTDLRIDDPRLLLFNDLKHMAVIPGHNEGCRRIGRPIKP